jgi:hypothetical protein
LDFGALQPDKMPGNLALFADPEKNFVVIMKDGKVYKHSVR